MGKHTCGRLTRFTTTYISQVAPHRGCSRSCACRTYPMTGDDLQAVVFQFLGCMLLRYLVELNAVADCDVGYQSILTPREDSFEGALNEKMFLQIIWALRTATSLQLDSHQQASCMDSLDPPRQYVLFMENPPLNTQHPIWLVPIIINFQ